ncbi:uncharacterized protein DMENIID0001_120710 [Sergentomyia squamirostris]
MSEVKWIPKGRNVFQLGDTFNSYQELEERLEAHSRESFVTYWRRDTRTVKGAHRKTSRRISKDLIYYSLRLACVFGGQKFLTRGQGKRSCQTIRSDCPAQITLRASKCGQKLEVISVCNIHNHELSERLNKSLPQNRKLSAEMKEEVILLLQTSISRNLIIDYIRLKTGKELTKKDLCNLNILSRKKKIEDSVGKIHEILEKMKNFLVKHSSMPEDFELEFYEENHGVKIEDKSFPEEISHSLPANDEDMEDNNFVSEYHSELPVNSHEVKNSENSKKRKRWKNFCRCQCRSSTVKLLELRVKFLRLKCKKLSLEVQELKKRRK